MNDRFPEAIMELYKAMESLSVPALMFCNIDKGSVKSILDFFAKDLHDIEPNTVYLQANMIGQ